MPSKDTTPLSLYGNDREYLREQERTNELLADIAGETYESPGDIPKGKYIVQKRLLDAAQKKNELLESIAGGGGTGGGGAAKGIGIDYATDVISLKNKDGETIQGSGATLPAYGVSFDPTTGGLTLTKNGTAMQGQTVTIPNYGSPVGVTDSADMVDEGTIYLYEGTTGGGFTNGHFYYYDGSAWADGGEYAAATVQTDKTLLVENRAADAKAVGEAVGALKESVSETTRNLFDITGISGTGLTVTDGIINGTSTDFRNNFGGNSDGIAASINFKSNTQYVVSAKAKNDTGEDTNTGLFIRIRYTDNLRPTTIMFNNADTEYVEKSAVSTAGKTISKIEVSYENKGSYLWHLKDFKIEEGSSQTEFIPHITATDYVAREAQKDVNNQLQNMAEEMSDFEENNFGQVYFDFEQGSLSGSDGSPVTASNTIRTIIDNTILNIKKIKIICEDGYNYAIRYYNNAGTMIETISFGNSTEIYDIPSNAIKIGLCIRKTTGDITPAACGMAKIYTNLTSAVIQNQNNIDLLGRINVSEYLSQTFATVVEYNRSQKFINIGFVTDTHSNENDASFAINTMNAILATKMMDVCVHGGDIITTKDLSRDTEGMAPGDYIREMCSNMAFYKNHGDMIFVKGNHDINHSNVASENATSYQYHMMMQNHIKDAVFNENDPFTCYFYKDFTNEKVRMIVLDSFPNDPDALNIDSVQLTWLYETALRTVEDGWTVIVFSHLFVDSSTSNNSLKKACNIFKAFNHRGTSYGDNNEYYFDDDITTHFVGVIHGHLHTDAYKGPEAQTYIEDFNIIGVRNGFGITAAVDIFTIDTQAKKLYQSRIGYGISRTYNYT